MFPNRISDPRSLGSWCLKRTTESLSRMDSGVRLMRHDRTDHDLGSLILGWIIPKECTLKFQEHLQSIFMHCVFRAFLTEITDGKESDENEEILTPVSHTYDTLFSKDNLSFMLSLYKSYTGHRQPTRPTDHRAIQDFSKSAIRKSQKLQKF